jgi:uncharacterized protein
MAGYIPIDAYLEALPMWRDAVSARIETLEHPAWGPAHFRRLYELCIEIAEEDELDVDEDVLFAAAWLHDIGMFGEFACMADDPPTCAAEAAAEILPASGFPAERVDLVCRIIAEHSFEGEGRDTPEACLLRDADMLEFLGVVGLTRLISLVGLEDWVPDVRSAIDLALEFAEDLPDRLLLNASRYRAEELAEETRAFVQSLADRTSGLEAL